MLTRSFRLLERPQCILFPKCAFQRSQAYSTIFSTPKRRIDGQAFKNMKTTLLYVLRSDAGREHGFCNRDDGYVSVRRLLNHPEFQSLDIGRLQSIVSTDKKHRFDFEFDANRGDGDLYWIRAKQWNEAHWVMKPVLPKDQLGSPVYATTLEQWQNHISRNGIPRGEHDWIEISCTVPTQEYLLDLDDHQQVFIYLNLSQCIGAGLKFFSPTPSSQKWSYKTPLVTRGNEAGYIPPSLFSQVELVTAKTKLLWGDPTPIYQGGWVGFDEVDFTPEGKRKTYLHPVKGITGFVSTKAFRSEDGLRLENTPGLKDEAMAILQS